MYLKHLINTNPYYYFFSQKHIINQFDLQYVCRSQNLRLKKVHRAMYGHFLVKVFGLENIIREIPQFIVHSHHITKLILTQLKSN